MSTPGRSPAATISAMPVPSQEMTSGKSRSRGRSGRQAVDWPYDFSEALDIGLSASRI